MKYFLLLCLCLLSVNIHAQSCNCPAYFRDMVSKIETNYVGFNFKVTAANREEYRHFTDSLEKSAATADVPACLSAMAKWLSFFKDYHVGISINEDSTNFHKIRQAFAHTERHAMSEQEFISYLDRNRHRLDSLEGIWEDESKAYRIGIIRDEQAPDTFIGFVIDADSLFWMPGQVKLKIKKSAGNYEYIAFYSRNHQESVPPLKVSNGRLENGSFGSWYRAYPAPQIAKTTLKPGASLAPYFKVLDRKTCLIAIPRAMLEYKDEIDSMLTVNDALLKSTEHFIIDLRNNRGGSVLCFQKLLPLIYTNPMITGGSSVLATEENLKSYEDWDYPNISDSMKAIFRKEAAELRAHKGTLYNLWPDDTLRMAAVYPYPKRVSVLINEACASSTEIFLLKAKQSTKVKLYGRNTMGAVDYSDAASLTLDGGLFRLRYSTSRANRLPKDPIDYIGIRPDEVIPDNVDDWVGYVKKKN